MRTMPPAERYATNQITAMASERPPTWQAPAFPTREVRAAALVPGDVIAERVTGEPLTVLALGYPVGYVVIYAMNASAHERRATDRLHFTPRQLVRRAVPHTSDATPGRPATQV